MPLPAHLERLLDPAAYPHPVAAVRLIETHISWVFIAGEFAYKVKKPVDFGFLDFSTLEKRRVCCDEEVRLNRRLAPAIYLDVVAVTDTGIGPGEAREWAVRMRAFPSDATLDREAAVTPEQIDAIAERVARFHGEVERTPEGSEYGTPEKVMYPVWENFRQIRELLPSPPPLLAQLEDWSEREYLRLGDHFAARKANGFIRECHGDLHLGNIAWVDGAPLIFDCIEFNPDLRFVDVVSEVAFLSMDLIARGQEALAWRFLNRWLEHTGDYAGLAALRFYMVYRATVRAKVAGLRAGQGDAGAGAERMRYLDLAGRLGLTGRPALILMHGLSGSGKTWLSQRILEAHGAVRLRSDVERKRLFGLAPLADSAAIQADIYTPEASQRTFSYLLALAESLLAEGYRVIIDATFLKPMHRAPFTAMAARCGIRWRIASLKADVAQLERRIAERCDRRDDASEASLAVLEAQRHDYQAITGEEAEHCVEFDCGDTSAWPALIASLAPEPGSHHAASQPDHPAPPTAPVP
jgi:aminoglycoside phosphotransferase family enzyme/predicted kinase